MLNTEILGSSEEPTWPCCVVVVPTRHQPCWAGVSVHPLWPEEAGDVFPQYGGLSPHHGHGAHHCQDVLPQPDGRHLPLCCTVGGCAWGGAEIWEGTGAQWGAGVCVCSVTEIRVFSSGPFPRDWPAAQISGPAGKGAGTAQQSIDGTLQQDHSQSSAGESSRTRLGHVGP